MDYTELDKGSQLSQIRGRIKEVEQQHFTLQLRIDSPDLTMPVNEMDVANLELLSNSLDKLRELERSLS